jgi:hypothetical protein
MLSVNRTCLLHGDSQKVSNFFTYINAKWEFLCFEGFSMSRVSTLVLPKVVRLGELGGSTLVQQAMGGVEGKLGQKI